MLRTTKELNQIIRENICGDGYDADARAENIMNAFNTFIFDFADHVSNYYDDPHLNGDPKAVIDLYFKDRRLE